LTGCLVVPFIESEAHEAGLPPDKSRTADAIDAVVVTIALGRQVTAEGGKKKRGT